MLADFENFSTDGFRNQFPMGLFEKTFDYYRTNHHKRALKYHHFYDEIVEINDRAHLIKLNNCK